MICQTQLMFSEKDFSPTLVFYRFLGKVSLWFLSQFASGRGTEISHMGISMKEMPSSQNQRQNRIHDMSKWKTMSLPSCGLYLGSGIYNTFKHHLYLDPGAFSTWTPQDYSPLDYLDFIVADNQGNLAQIWGFGGKSAQVEHRFRALEDLNIPFPESDWKNRKNITPADSPDFSQYADREGAGLIKFIEKAKSLGIYTTGLYSSEILPQWAGKLKEFGPWYLGYDFGERYSFHLNRGSNHSDGEGQNHEPTLEDYADGLIARVSAHVRDRKAKGWGYVMATSGSFHLDYEMLGGTDIPVQEDFAFRHLTISSAFARGLFRQFRLPVWGSHLAHEHYSWIPYASKYKFPLLSSAFLLKYLHGCKLIINESGNWYTQVKLCPDSPLRNLPFCNIGKNLAPDAPASNHPYDYADRIPEAEKLYATIDYRSPTAVKYRKCISDFYDFVKENGTPAGQPEASFAIAKGNLDLSAAYVAKDNYAIASAYDLADRNHDWYEGAPERSWDVIQKVFCPCPPVTDPYPNQSLSATPLGVFDVVSFAKNKITAEFLHANYKALIFAGWNTSSSEQYEILKEYVRSGGILCLNLPHLSTNRTRNYRSFSVEELVNGGDFSELCGFRVVRKGRRIYWATAPSEAPNELGIRVQRRFGILALPIGELEITDPKVKVLIADDEQFDPIVLSRQYGKGEVLFVNTWGYPGALDVDDGPGAVRGSTGLMGAVYAYVAKRARGHVYVTDDYENPGENCRYVNCTYFPDAGKICLYNIDFDQPHTVIVHAFGYPEEHTLAPSEFLTLDTVKLRPDEKQNDD